MVCLMVRPYPLKFFKGCPLQILLGPFLNILSQMKLNEDSASYGPFLDQYINAWIYNVSPVPQITRFLLVDATILSKTNL